MSIEKAYNSWSNQYDTNDNKTRDLDKKATQETLVNYTFKNVIELGCGTGKNTKLLLEKAEKIIGLDFSDGMLKRATAKIKNPKVRFQKADLTKDWKVVDNFADLITCSLTLEHIKNIDFIFEQVQLKLKSKGLFFICELHPFKQYLGSKARYETDKGTEELEVYVHHISEYLESAKKNSFKLIEIKEWFDTQEKKEMPRLVSFVFKKETCLDG